MKVKFQTWEDEDITIPIEEVECIEPRAFLDMWLETKNGKTYQVYGKLTFVE